MEQQEKKILIEWLPDNGLAMGINANRVKSLDTVTPDDYFNPDIKAVFRSRFLNEPMTDYPDQ